MDSTIVQIFDRLMPGLLAAWLFYSFTAHTRPSQFERVVEALIFSFLISVAVTVFGAVALWFGQWINLGLWDRTAELFVTVLLACAFGLGAAYLANSDRLHQLLRSFGLTRRTAYPSEWYGAFAEHVTFIVLHLHDGRRIFGWPLEWPSSNQAGHFRLTQAAWLGDDGVQTELPQDEAVLVAANNVELVEFVASEESHES